MSLSEQIQRVDGSQNDILKKILTAFGVTIDDEKIDEIAELAEAANNLKANGILSTTTKTAFGLTASAAPDDVFSVLENAAILKNGTLQLPNGGTIPGIRTEYGTYVGTGQYGSGHPNTITASFNLQIVFIVGTYIGTGVFTILLKGAERATSTAQDCFLTWSGNSVSWYSTGNQFNQLNDSRKTYYYFAIGVEN